MNNKLTKVDKVFIPTKENSDIGLSYWNGEEWGGCSNLEEQNNKYILSEEEIIKLISDAWDTGRKSFEVISAYDYEQHHSYLKKVENSTQEQYIKQILTQ